MGDKSAKWIDQSIAQLAGNQHGHVSLSQLEALGASRGAVSKRSQTGRLHRVHQGVYAVGHPNRTNEGKWIAAVLACGDGAVLSHRAAAALWRLLPPPTGPVDVTVPGNAGRTRRRGIRIHRSTTLTQQATTRRANIPVTTPARTLLDLRSCVDAKTLGRARRQAEVLGYRLDEASEIEPDLTRSELEGRFLRLCERASLPSPEVNARVGDYEVDFLWRRSGLIAETDGWRYHRGRASFEHDHRRQAQLVALGYEVLRFTWRQIADEPDEVIAALRARLTPQLGQRMAP
jgi:hypothetical protein